MPSEPTTSSLQSSTRGSALCLKGLCRRARRELHFSPLNGLLRLYRLTLHRLSPRVLHQGAASLHSFSTTHLRFSIYLRHPRDLRPAGPSSGVEATAPAPTDASNPVGLRSSNPPGSAILRPSTKLFSKTSTKWPAGTSPSYPSTAYSASTGSRSTNSPTSAGTDPGPSTWWLYPFIVKPPLASAPPVTSDVPETSAPAGASSSGVAV